MMKRLLLCAALLSPEMMGAQQNQTSDWREDLRFLSAQLPRRHKNAFARMTRAQWDSASRRLDARLPRLARHEIIVEMMRLVAMVGDGHTLLAPEAEERMGFHRLPVQLYDFADGLFIVAADSTHADLVGARVTRIGRMATADAMTAAAAVASHESPNWARMRAQSLLAIPEVLAGLGITGETNVATFVVQQAGRERAVRLRGAGSAAGDPRPVPAGWVPLRDSSADGEPLYQQRAGNPFWYSILPDRTLYINYRAVVFFANDELNETFFRRAFAAGDSAGVQRVVLDMRANGGGNNFLNRFVVKEIIRRPALDQADKLFVLIGRGVFSAAQNLVNELDYYTNATFVGEPTGNAPNQYGDARPLELPRSHLVVRVSSLYWQGHSAADERTSFPPDIYVETTSGDFRARRDPVLATALRRATEPGLDRTLANDGERGDTAAVCRLIEAYRANSENRYRDIQADVNTAGYRLMRAGQVAAAITVFQVNASSYPRSANVYDSLGEALERAGRRNDAIASYRKAVELNPDQFSARDALRRLGALQ